MRQPRADFRMADISPDILTRLTPTKLTFHWKAAAIYTATLGVAALLLFLSFHRYTATFAPDYLQANLRLACLPFLLAFCFVAVSIQRLAPCGMMPSVVFLTTSLALWIATAAASLDYGLTDAQDLEWVKTTLMLLTTLGMLLLGLGDPGKPRSDSRTTAWK